MTDDAAPWVPERLSLRSLRESADECRGCELWERATQAVMGDGPRDASLLLVGEQPGDREDLVGEPFVGPAGRLLDEALEQAGIAPDSVFKTNAVKHFRFTERGKRRIHQSPAQRHVHACRPWLMAEIDLIRPAGIILLGATAGATLYGSGFRLGPVRGRRTRWPADIPVAHPPDWVLPTTHPSAVLRSRHRDEDLERLVTDLKRAVVSAA